ncbi:MAG: glycoside hydrolase family 2 TIM barrel-domain containing protein, partial [Rikenellaceae bacterium]
MRKILIIILFFATIYPSIAQNEKFTKVAENDCGQIDKQSFCVSGEDYTIPENIGGSLSERTVSFGGKVIYAFDKVDINADYQLEVVYLSDNDTRRQQIAADGNVVQEEVALKKGIAQRYLINLPRKAYAYGQLVLVFEGLAPGNNTVVSEVNVYSSNPRQLVPFVGERKEALKQASSYVVDTNVDADKVLPVYAPIAKNVFGVANPSLTLNGMWQFKENCSADFYNQPIVGWKNIYVPGQWSMQGFKVDSAGYGGYYRSFIMPEDWKSHDIKVRFEGVHSEYSIYLNGKEVGFHEGGMTPYEIDITKNIVDGENKIFLRVRSESTADMLGSLTQYAAHQLGGITRPVTIFALPKVHLTDLRVITDLDKNYVNADLKLFLKVKNSSSTTSNNSSIRVSIAGLKSVLVDKIPALAAGKEWSGTVSMKVDAPKKWDSEHPNLYTMNVELRSGDQIQELISKKIGFREIEIRGNRMFVNGTAVKLRGVCRHEVHPLTGRTLTTDDRRRDVELYRAANCNFIRTSHYPPCEELLDICDELGMFVEVEAPVCWMGHQANASWEKLDYRDKKYYDYVLQANMESIHINRNHPSVLFWSMANESYWNEGFAQVLEYMKKADPSRPISFHDQGYGGYNNQGSTTHVANIHYPGPSGFKKVADWTRPITYGEFCHLNVYNRSELVTDPGIRSDWALALLPTWDNMYKTNAILGGSIWSGIDDVFQLPDGNAVGYGEWGPIDGWRREKPEYWDMKKIYSPVKVRTSSIKAGDEIKLDIENRYVFTNFNELNIQWKYGDEGGRLLIDLQPADSTIIKVPVKNLSAANQLYISFTDGKGTLIDEYLIAVGDQPQNVVEIPSTATTHLKTTNSKISVTGTNFVCDIDRSTGRIITMKHAGEEIICGGPWLMALPLQGGGCMPNHNANTPIFNDVCSAWKVSAVTAQKVGESVEVKVTGSYAEFSGSYTMNINANGMLATNYSFTSNVDLNPRQWGLVFESPESFNTTFWRRNGLWSIYPSDHISRAVGSAKLFYDGVPRHRNPRTEPQWSWSYDSNDMGSADFRSTRRNI